MAWDASATPDPHAMTLETSLTSTPASAARDFSASICTCFVMAEKCLPLMEDAVYATCAFVLPTTPTLTAGSAPSIALPMAAKSPANSTAYFAFLKAAEADVEAVTDATSGDDFREAVSS